MKIFDNVKDFVKVARDYEGETRTKDNKTYHNGELIAEYVKNNQ